MKKQYVTAAVCALGLGLILAAQQSDVLIKITQGERAAIAVPDFRGSGAAQPLMGAFNETLYADIETSGLFRMVPKTMQPIEVDGLGGASGERDVSCDRLHGGPGRPAGAVWVAV